MIFFCFSLVFLYSINNIQIANILYFFYFIKNYIVDEDKLKINFNLSFVLYCSFVVWVSLSTIAYFVEMQYLDIRFIVKYLFTLQYAVLIMPLKLNEKKFEVSIYRFSIILSVMIILLFFYFAIFNREFLIIGMQTRLWAVDFIPGWPNSTPIPLLLGLWLSFRNQFGFIGKIIIYIALILTFSRGALLGLLLITGFFVYSFIVRNFKRSWHLLLGSVALMIIIVSIVFQTELASKLYFHDRADIFRYFMLYFENRPLLGYGGNTFDQLKHIQVSYTPYLDWPHTHNLILEMVLRYGVIGGLLFTAYLMSVFLKIKNTEKKAMFAILFFLGLFQTFMQEFIYIFFLSYLASEYKQVPTMNKS